VVLYGCGTWSLALREKHRLSVFENKALRRIFGPKRFEATEDWRKLHNEELHNLCSSPDIIRLIKSRRTKWTRYVARMREKRIFVGKPEGTRPLGRSRRRWVGNIKIDMRDIGWDGMEWIDLAQYRDQCKTLVNTVMNLLVSYNAGKLLSDCAICSFSRKAQLRR
jgi:hypothetical protein